MIYPIFVKTMASDVYVEPDYQTNMVVSKNSKEYAQSEASWIQEYLNNCVSFVKELSQYISIDPSVYISIITKNPSTSRYTPIKNSITSGEIPKDISKPLIDMDGAVNNTQQYIAKTSEFESVMLANSLISSRLNKPPYVSKMWLYSGKKNTRHLGMNGIVVPVDEPFEVVNDRTGETSFLMYPKDYANDPTGANTVNCGCDIVYLTQKL